jgi:hypothetical protein
MVASPTLMLNIKSGIKAQRHKESFAYFGNIFCFKDKPYISSLPLYLYYSGVLIWDTPVDLVEKATFES